MSNVSFLSEDERFDLYHQTRMATEHPQTDHYAVQSIPEDPIPAKGHEHDWIDTYKAGGFSKESPELEVLVFFCKKCLEIRVKKVRTNVILDHDVLELWEVQGL